MKTLKQHLKRIGHRIGWLGTIILMLPILSWLIQYVSSKGFTTNRFIGLLYGIGGVILVLGFLVWALRKPQEPRNA